MKRIILLAGPAQVGKTTTANIIKKKLEEKGLSVAIINFSDALKEMCKSAFAPLLDYLNANYYSAEISHDTWWENKHPIQRMLLQIVGTEIVRQIDPDYWAKCAKALSIKREELIVIFPDFRFPNEHDAFYYNPKFKTVTIQVVGRDTSEVFKGVSGHKSENSLQNFEFDVHISNKGDLENLEKEVDSFVSNFLIRNNKHLTGESSFISFDKDRFHFETDTGVEFSVPMDEMKGFRFQSLVPSSHFISHIKRALEAKNGNG